MTSLSLTPAVSEKPSYLEIGSVIKICKGADQVLVYGWKHCKYDDVTETLQDLIGTKGFPFKQVFSYRIGNPFDCYKTLSGRYLTNLVFEHCDYMLKTHNSEVVPSIVLSRLCKTGITNLVLENYKRIHEGLPLIPVLFCIDIDGNPQPLRIDHLASKDPKFNKQVTYKELRRAYKLCTHENAKIREAAMGTFRFVKLVKIQEAFSMQEIAAPWADPRFSQFWSLRKKLSKSEPKEETFNWRMQLNLYIQSFEEPLAESDDEVMEEESPRSLTAKGTKRKADEDAESHPAKRARTEETPKTQKAVTS